MPSHLVTKKTLSVSQEIKILGGECLAALLSHTNLSSCKRTSSADGSVLLQYATEAKQFPSFPTGHQLPLQALPQHLVPLVLPRKDLLSRHHNSSCVPTELRLPVRRPNTCRSTAPPEPHPTGRGHPAPPGQRPDTSCALHRDPNPSPLPRDPAGGRAAAAVLSGVRTARAQHGLPPAGHHRHTRVTTRTAHALHLPATADGERTPTAGARGSALRGGTGTGIPVPGHSRVTTARHTDTDKQEKDGEESSPLPLP